MEEDQTNGQKKKQKMTNNDPQKNHTQLKTGVNPGAPEW